MGQRHQIYIRVNTETWKDRKPTINQVTLGFHHQWLYGLTALQVLDNFLEACKNSVAQDNKYGTFSYNGDLDAKKEAFKTILSYLPRTGTVERLHDISDEHCVKDPAYGDNNDGITVIDLVDPANPKYCFYSIGCTEGEYSLDEGIYNAEQYLESYWSKDKWNELSGRDGPLDLNTVARLNVTPMLDMARLYEIFPEMKKRHKMNVEAA